MPGITFPVADLPAANQPSSTLAIRASVEKMLRRSVEAMDLSNPHLVCCKDAHPFAQAAHDAFYDHFPLTISPDDVWFCIAQGFSHHVNLNSKGLRHLLVKHAGKKKLIVDRPDFTLGQPNPWPQVFNSFSKQIGDHVGKELRDTIVADFSTTTAFHVAATEVVMMETFQPYFEYEMRIGCGIPAINLTGAPDDWRNIRRRASNLASFGMKDWLAVLIPVLDKIEATSRGHIDRDFWNSFFRYESGSLGTELTGWILTLFPYLKDPQKNDGPLVPNPYLKSWRSDFDNSLARETLLQRHGPYLLHIPAGIASAPVRVLDGHSGKTHSMRFVAGMFGVSQNPADMNLSCSFGWAIVYDEIQPAAGRLRRFLKGLAQN